MKAKEAVKTAIEYVRDLFKQESIQNLGLEEVEYDESDSTWLVTVGFSRPWNRPTGIAASIQGNQPHRDYKVVRISDSSGEVKSIKNREVD